MCSEIGTFVSQEWSRRARENVTPITDASPVSIYIIESWHNYISNTQHHRLVANVNAAVALPNYTLTTVMLNSMFEDSFASHAITVLANWGMPQVGCNKRLIILKEQMTDTPVQKLRKLSTELGSPGMEALWKASRKAGIAVTKADVQEVVRGSPSKQIFGKLQPSDGKTVSRTSTENWQMDLADFSNSPAEYKGGKSDFF